MRSRNSSISVSAEALRKLVHREIILSVPSFEIMTRKSAAALISQRERENLVAVQQQFDGPFAGRAMVIFPESSSVSLVRAILSGEIDDAELLAMSDEALAETGNVVLNGCLGAMANMLQQTLTISLPRLQRGDSHALFETLSEAGDDAPVLFLYINFSIRERDVKGYVAVLIDLPSLGRLKQLIAEFIDWVRMNRPCRSQWRNCARYSV